MIEPIPGKSHALNTALPLAMAPLIAFVDDDHRIDTGYLEAVWRAAQEQQDADFFCGRVHPDWDGSEPRGCISKVDRVTRTSVRIYVLDCSNGFQCRWSTHDHSKPFRNISIPKTAKELGLHDSQVYGWRSKARPKQDQRDREQSQAAEIARLKCKLAEQAEELTIVKRANNQAVKALEFSGEPTSAAVACLREPCGRRLSILIAEVHP
jgi:transposase-like protein